MNFIEKCLAGDALLEEIDEHIEKWHEGIEGEDQELHDYLGMSWEEYSLWGTTPSIISHIIAARRRRSSLADELNRERYSLAARASDPEEAAKMEKWLRRIGKLK